MALFQEFLSKLEGMVSSDSSTNLRDFVDLELSKVYRDILMSETGYLPKINLTLKKLNNSYLSKILTLNYYFDHIYVLNMDRRPDRLQMMAKELKERGIFNWSRWVGLDGRQKPHYDEWQVYRRQRMTAKEKMRYNRKAIGSAGSWAILKSMYRMIKDAQAKNYKSILVLQDDLLFHRNFVEEFLRMPKAVPKNWKLLYLGATQHNWNHVEFRSKYYFPMGTADGAFAVGIHSSLFRELLDEIVKFDMPVDSGALKTLQRRYGRQCMVMQPNLVIADIRDSDLRNHRDLDTYSSKFRWNLNLYNFKRNR